jgi:hypothetical protein
MGLDRHGAGLGVQRSKAVELKNRAIVERQPDHWLGVVHVELGVLRRQVHRRERDRPAEEAHEQRLSWGVGTRHH